MNSKHTLFTQIIHMESCTPQKKSTARDWMSAISHWVFQHWQAFVQISITNEDKVVPEQWFLEFIIFSNLDFRTKIWRYFHKLSENQIQIQTPKCLVIPEQVVRYNTWICMRDSPHLNCPSSHSAVACFWSTTASAGTRWLHTGPICYQGCLMQIRTNTVSQRCSTSISDMNMKGVEFSVEIRSSKDTMVPTPSNLTELCFLQAHSHMCVHIYI